MAPGGAAAAASKYEDAAAVGRREEEIGVGWFAGDCAKTEGERERRNRGKKSRGNFYHLVWMVFLRVQACARA